MSGSRLLSGQFLRDYVERLEAAVASLGHTCAFHTHLQCGACVMRAAMDGVEAPILSAPLPPTGSTLTVGSEPRPPNGVWVKDGQR